jgi:hypothetical protein
VAPQTASSAPLTFPAPSGRRGEMKQRVAIDVRSKLAALIGL